MPKFVEDALKTLDILRKELLSGSVRSVSIHTTFEKDDEKPKDDKLSFYAYATAWHYKHGVSAAEYIGGLEILKLEWIAKDR